MYLRMINKKAKWEENKQKPIENISSDIITNCLKTKDETLSLWYIDDESKVDDALIALSSNRDLLQKLDYLVIPDDLIKKYNLALEKKPGKSPYLDFNENHFDIVNIDYECLGKIAEMIIELINSKSAEICRAYEDDLKEKLSIALKSGKLSLELIKEDLLKKIS